MFLVKRDYRARIHESLELPHLTLINRATVGRCDIPGKDSLKYSRRADPMSLEIGFSPANLRPASGTVDLSKHTQPNSARSGIQLVIRAVCKRKVWCRVGSKKEL